MKIGQVLLIVAVVGTGVGAAVTRSSERASGGTTSTVGSEPTLAEVRQLTERFRDVKVALAEGYIRDPSNMCETAERWARWASTTSGRTCSGLPRLHRRA